jgi:hypothetical protein
MKYFHELNGSFAQLSGFHISEHSYTLEETNWSPQANDISGEIITSQSKKSFMRVAAHLDSFYGELRDNLCSNFFDILVSFY